MRMLSLGFPRPPLFQPAALAPTLDDLRQEMDRLWTGLTAAPPLHGWALEATTGVFPAVNLTETDEAVVIEAELPGLDTEDLEITATHDEMVLKGNRGEAAGLCVESHHRQPDVGNGEKAGSKAGVSWQRRERGTGSFERRFSLPTAVDPEKIEARLVDGVLTITCQKAPESRPHRVAVRASGT